MIGWCRLQNLYTSSLHWSILHLADLLTAYFGFNKTILAKSLWLWKGFETCWLVVSFVLKIATIVDQVFFKNKSPLSGLNYHHLSKLKLHLLTTTQCFIPFSTRLHSHTYRTFSCISLPLSSAVFQLKDQYQSFSYLSKMGVVCTMWRQQA